MKNNKINRILIISIVFIFKSVILFAQGWTPENAFRIEEFGNAYNERGFSKDNVNNEDGNLSITPSTRQLLYSYPVYNNNINGSQIQVDLTYCSNVSYMSLAAFDQSNVSWRSFSLNRPVWIIGVNGFAVQAFSFTNMPTNQPKYFSYSHNEWENVGQAFKIELDDTKSNWLIPGYDYCNRMNSLRIGNAKTSDVIKLLRSDGSVLELVNIVSCSPNDSIYYDDNRVYTGYYYENTANSKAFAIVSFYGEKDSVEHFYSNRDLITAKPNIPRLLRYYPGDGLEYIFIEYLAPFSGVINEHQDPSGLLPSSGFSFGLVNKRTINGNDLPFLDATPSIFYLVGIRNQNKIVASIKYSKHVDAPFIEFSPSVRRVDNSSGRALLESINCGEFNDEHGISFQYRGSVELGFDCNINSPNRTIHLQFDKDRVKFFGKQNFGVGYSPDFRSFRDVTAFSKKPSWETLRYLYQTMENYFTFIPYITKIDDHYTFTKNSQQVIFFGYKKKEMKFSYAGSTLPYFLDSNPDEHGTTISTSDYLLDTIVEPTRKMFIEYTIDESIPVAGCDLSGPFPPDEAYHYNYFNNAISKIEYFQRKPNDIITSDNRDRINNTFPDLNKVKEENYEEFNSRCRGGKVSITHTIKSFLNSNQNDFIKRIYNYDTINLSPIKDFQRSPNNAPFPPTKFIALSTQADIYQTDDTIFNYITYNNYKAIELESSNSQYWATNIVQPISIMKTYSKKVLDDIVTAPLVTDYSTYYYGFDTSYIKTYGKDIDSADTNFLKSKYLNIKLCKRLYEKTERKMICNQQWFDMTQDEPVYNNLDSNYYQRIKLNYLQLPPFIFGKKPYQATNKDKNYNSMNNIAQIFDSIAPPFFDINNKKVVFDNNNNFLEGSLDSIEVRYRISKTSLEENNLLYCRGKVIESYRIFDSLGTNKINLSQLSYHTNTDESGLGNLKESWNFSNSKLGFNYTYQSFLGTSLNQKYLFSDHSITNTQIFQNEKRNLSFDYRNTPAVTWKEIRKYKNNPQNNNYELMYDTLLSYNLVNPYGLPVFKVNENGWLSSFDYNCYNALEKAVLPYDFISLSQINDFTVNCFKLGGIGICNYSSQITYDSCEIWDDRTYHYGSSTKTTLNGLKNELIAESSTIMTPYYDGCFKGSLDFLIDQYNNSELKADNNSENELSNSKKINGVLSDHAVVFTNKWFTFYDYKSYIHISFKKTDRIQTINSITKADLHLPIKRIEGTSSFSIILKEKIGSSYNTLMTKDVFISSFRLENGSSQTPPISENYIISLDGDWQNTIMNKLNTNSEIYIEVAPGASEERMFYTPSNGLIEISNSTHNRNIVVFDNNNILKDNPYLDLEGEAVLNLDMEPFTVKYDYNYIYNNDSVNFRSNKYQKIDDRVNSYHDFSSQSNNNFYDFLRASCYEYNFAYDYNMYFTRQLYNSNNLYIGDLFIDSNLYNGFGQQIAKYQNWYDPNSLISKTSPTLSLFDTQGRLLEKKFPQLLGNDITVMNEPLQRNRFRTFDPANSDPLTFSEFDGYPELKTWVIGDYADEFYGVCHTIDKIASKSESNDNYLSTREYYDAFNRLKATVYFNINGNQSSPLKAIKNEYDHLNRVKKTYTLKNIQNTSSEQITRYWYDPYGRIKYKYQPDLGVQAFSYDNLGNLRFSQNSNQLGAVNDKISFFEYDDLNRMTIAGEAEIAETSLPSRTKIIDPSLFLDNDYLNLNWITDQTESVIKVNKLNLGIDESLNLLTSNYTLFLSNDLSQGILPADFWLNTNCVPLIYNKANLILGNDYKPKAPLVMHPAYFYESVNSASLISSFENIAYNPHNVLRAYHYDELPQSTGKVWGHFPEKAIWNSMCQNDLVENLKGKLSAMAYREHNGQPFNYMVFSYDARGRVIAVLKLTDNVGFDAIYYSYNSANKLISVRVCDETKSMTTWYDYDNYGRLSKVWSTNPNDVSSNYGLAGNASDWHNTLPVYPAEPAFNPLSPPTPDVQYWYYPNSLLKTKTVYNNIDSLTTNYSYNYRFWLDTIRVKSSVSEFYHSFINYNIVSSIPQITIQESGYSGITPPGVINSYYNYDKLNQLTGSSSSNNQLPENFTYDNLGNRTNLYKGFPNIYPYHNTDYTFSDISHPNRMIETQSKFYTAQNLYQEYFFSTKSYFNNGALKSSYDFNLVQSYPQNQLWERTQNYYEYDMFGLMNRFYYADDYAVEKTCFDEEIDYDSRTEWRYRYNPFNEREQKRMYYAYGGNKNGNVYPWVYYQLGVNNQQYVTYNGFNISDPVYFIGNNQVCTNPYPQIVFMYPVEYNIFGADTKADMTYRLDGEGNWRKDIMCYDHLGNVMVSLRANETSGDFDVTGRYFYRAFGERIPVGTQTDSNRLTFINKEKDYESGLGDFGVRKYDDGIGRFTSIDPLFEKYPGWTPYQYSLNNPVNMKDDNGREIFASGACVDEGLSYMNGELSFQIKSDATSGKLSVPGIVNPQNPAEQVILDAISDPNVTLNVDFTSENTMNDINGALQQVFGGMYGGSKINANGSVNALQGINIDHFKVGDESTGGDRVGQNVIHEVLEGYIGAVTKPGTTYKDSYLLSHSTALTIYPLSGKNTVDFRKGMGCVFFYYNGKSLYSLPNSTFLKIQENISNEK